MNKPMTMEEARKVEREPIKVGDTRTFFCEVVEEGEEPLRRLRNYTGQDVVVLAEYPPGSAENNDPDNSPLYLVRFPDGREAQAWEEELNGWDRDLGQFVGPSGQWGDTK